MGGRGGVNQKLNFLYLFSCENAVLQVLLCSVCLSVCLCVLKFSFYSFLASTTFHNSLWQLIRSQIKSDQVRSSQIKSDQIKSDQIKSIQIKSNQIKSNQIRSNQINQIKLNQIKSNQIKSIRSHFGSSRLPQAMCGFLSAIIIYF